MKLVLRTLFCIIILFNLSLGLLEAGGLNEDDLMSQARQLVIEKNYQKAMLVLAQIIEKKNSSMDEAEFLMAQVKRLRSRQLMDSNQNNDALRFIAESYRNDSKNLDEVEDMAGEIRRKKDLYNQLSQALIKNLTENPGGYKESLELIDAMLALEENPGEAIKAQLENARITAKLQVDRKTKNDLMAAALVDIQAAQLMEALKKYESGFKLLRTDFENGTQSLEFRTRALAYIDQLRTSVVTYQAAGIQMLTVLGDFNVAISGASDTAEPISDFNRFASQFLLAVRFPITFENSVDAVRLIAAEAEKDFPRNIYNEYLKFIQEFMSGPPADLANKQGIVFVAREYLEREYQSTLLALSQRYQSSKEQFAAFLAQDDLVGARNGFARLRARGLLYQRALSLQSGLDLGVNPSFEQIAANLAPRFQAQPNELLSELLAYDQVNAQVTFGLELRTLLADTGANAVERSLSSYDAILLSYSQYLASQNEQSGLPGLTTQVRNRHRLIAESLYQKNAASALAFGRQRYVARTNTGLTAIVSPITANPEDLNQARLYLNGLTTAVGSDTAILKFPDRALAQLNELENKTKLWQASLRALTDSIRAQRIELSGFAAVQSIVSQIDSTQTRLGQELAAVLSLKNQAQQNITRASALKTQAEQGIVRGRGFLEDARLDLDAAETAWEQSGDLFNSSFDLAFNNQERSQADQRLQDLRLEIDRVREVYLAKQIQSFVARARNEFDNEQFGLALDYINDADRYFKQTRPYKQNPKAEDEDIKYWRGRITAAGTLSQEKTIAESDPAYVTLANYLNLAQVDYLSAVELKKTGDEQRSKTLIARARSNILAVFQLKRNNSAAKLLQLKLDFLDDTTSFDDKFRRAAAEAMNTARLAIGSGILDDQINALTNIEALREINRGYYGFAAIISQIRIAIGLDPNPVDVRRKNESQALAQQAARIFALRNSARYNEALQLAQRALQIDPENRQASALSGDIRAAVGGIAVIMTTADERIFRQAQALYIQRRFSDSKILVDQLWNNTRNRLYVPLEQLKGRIEREL